MRYEEIFSIFSSEKWRVVREDDTLKATKGGYGFHGSVLFHLGLLVVFIAVVVSSITRFSAELLLTEGFPMKLGKDAFVKIYKNRWLSEVPSSVVELKRFVPSYEKGKFAKDFSAELSIDGARKDVHVNKPADMGGFQLSLHRFGFAPSFKVTDEKGREVLNATVNLVVVGGKEDSFLIPNTPYLIYTEFFPDFFYDNGRFGSRSIVPKNPVFLLRMTSNGRELGRNFVRLGDTVDIGGLYIKFDALNYWVDLIVGRDYGLWIFAAGFGMGVLGLALRFVFPDKQMEISITGNKALIKGWTKYFPDFFEEEIRRIVEKLQNQRLS